MSITLKVVAASVALASSAISLLAVILLLVPSAVAQDSTCPQEAIDTPISPTGPQWYPVAEFEGEGPGQTDIFRIASNQWRVWWAYNRAPGRFGPLAVDAESLDITGPGGTRIVTLSGIEEGVRILRGAGRWYLSIAVAAGEWHLWVEELR